MESAPYVASDVGLHPSVSATSSPILAYSQAGGYKTPPHTMVASSSSSQAGPDGRLCSSVSAAFSPILESRQADGYQTTPHVSSLSSNFVASAVRSGDHRCFDSSVGRTRSGTLFRPFSPSQMVKLNNELSCPTLHKHTLHTHSQHEDGSGRRLQTSDDDESHGEDEEYKRQKSDVSDEEIDLGSTRCTSNARHVATATTHSLTQDEDGQDNLDKFNVASNNNNDNVKAANLAEQIDSLDTEINRLLDKLSNLKSRHKCETQTNVNVKDKNASREPGMLFEEKVKPSHNVKYSFAQKLSASQFADSHVNDKHKSYSDKHKSHDNVKLTHPLAAHNVPSQSGNIFEKYSRTRSEPFKHPMYHKEAEQVQLNDSFESCLSASYRPRTGDTNVKFAEEREFLHPLHAARVRPNYRYGDSAPPTNTHSYEPEDDFFGHHILTTNYVPQNNNFTDSSGFPRELARKFNGSPLEFESWKIRVSQEIIDNKYKPNIACEYILSQTTGPVKQLVLQIANVEFNASWQLVIEIFEEIKYQFAQDHMIRQAIQEEIAKHPRVTEDVESLNSFIRLCRKIDLHKKVCGDLIEFDLAEGTSVLRAKLPRSVQDDYGRKWRMYEERFHTAPPLAFFIEVVKNYRSKALSSRYAPISNDYASPGKDPIPTGKVGTRRIHVLESQDKDPSPQQASRTDGTDRPTSPKFTKQSRTNEKSSGDGKGSEERCPWHETSGHSIIECYPFLKLKIEERRDFIIKKGLCLNCLKRGHVASRCLHKEVCKICKRRHHYLLHYERQDPKKSQDVNVGCTTVCGDASFSAFCAKVVLVDLALASDPENSIRVYAIIDEQSNTTVVDERVADYFGGSYPTRDITTRFVTKKAVFRHEAKVLPDLRVKGVMSKYYEILKGALTYPSVANNKHQVATPEIVQRFAHTVRFAKYFPALDEKAEVMLLIGIDNIHIHRSDRLTKVAPYVHRTPIGYALVGKVCEDERKRPATILRIQASVTTLEEEEVPIIKGNFRAKPSTVEFDVLESKKDDEEEGFSVEDKLFLHMMKKGEVVAPTGELTYPLPIIKETDLPDNRDTVYRRTVGTLRNIQKNPAKLESVLKIMEKDLLAGHVEQLQQEKRKTGSDWYLPPFVVTHKRKGTPRIVFDAAAEFQEVSLNKLLLQGPDLLCNLRSVLLRFREKNIAVTADIQGMFLNFKVFDEHRRFLRFFWFQDNDPAKKLVPFQINTHAFGLKSSPAVANFALRSIADGISSPVQNSSEDPVSKALTNSFYVDDLLTSTDTVEEAQQILQGVSSRLSEYNILLHKFASSDAAVLRGLPNESLSVGMKNLPEEQSEQSALGVRWDTDKDTLSLTLNLPKREFTKRGILSVIGSLYDPIGFISPVILGGKIFQRTILPRKEDAANEISELNWDDPLPTNLLHKWSEWCSSLQGLEDLVLPRGLHPSNITPKKQCLCGFSDASENAIGYVIYLLTVDMDDKKHLGFVCGSSRVAPKSCNTIPRLELNAALLMARAVDTIRKSLSRDICSCLYFTDSRITLGYVQNETRRFTKYIERRASAIRDITLAKDWFYVSTDNNPADLATRPVSPQQLANSMWFSGPRFLIDGGVLDNHSSQRLPEGVQVDCTILKSEVAVKNDLVEAIFSRTNSLTKACGTARRALSLLHNVDLARQRLGIHLAPRNPLPTLYSGRTLLSRLSQEGSFSHEISVLKRGHAVSCKSSIHKLSPWIDEEGILRMEGRLSQSGLPWSVANPVILPKSSSLAKAVVLQFHHDCHHQGATITSSSISRGGFHIVGSSKLVKNILHRCVICQRLRGRAQEQKMSDLPKSRVTISPPFSNVGVDLFGPFNIKDTIATRRHNSTTKMWGCVFTCLASRAVHFEALSSLDTSSFLNAFKRFCAIRGQPKLVKSDRGGNFVSASKTLGGIDSNVVSRSLEKMNIKWEFNPPYASHFGGVWERTICSARRVMEGMLAELHQKTFDMESFVTLLAEASRIINFTPLWITSCDTDEPSPLCPADLLLISRCSEEQHDQPLNEKDLLAYGPRRHKRATYLTSIFWQRWEADYLVTLNQRSKWFRQLAVVEGDVVLVVDDSIPRSFWPLAIVSRVHPSSDGKIRKVTLKVGSSPIKYIERPISKTISILPKRYRMDLLNDNAIPLT